jgi:hypothetical protein
LLGRSASRGERRDPCALRMCISSWNVPRSRGPPDSDDRRRWVIFRRALFACRTVTVPLRSHRCRFRAERIMVRSASSADGGASETGSNSTHRGSNPSLGTSGTHASADISGG